MTLLTPQPPPRPTRGDIWADVLRTAWATRPVRKDMAARRIAGLRTYGTPLQTGNGRDFKADAYQEALDGIAYAEGRRQETGSWVWAVIRAGFLGLAEVIRRAP
jgi:hypothetical protein